jgi:hypothetical protein
MKRPFTHLAFREVRKKLEFVLPVDSRGHNNFRSAKTLPRRRRGYGRKLGAVMGSMSATMSIRTTNGSILRPGWKSALSNEDKERLLEYLKTL